jgi:hypothetical protein
MHNVGRTQVAVLLAIVLALAGCSTTQPDSAQAHKASLVLKTTGIIPLYHCWQVWRDVDLNGSIDELIDENLGTYRCDQVGTAQRNVPWRYTLAVTVIRQGVTFEELAVSDTGVSGSDLDPRDDIPPFASLTEYDPGVGPAADRQHLPEDGDIYYINGRELSNGSAAYLATQNFDLGPANILSLPTSFDFDVNPGDTIVVRARKQKFADTDPQFLPTDPDPQLFLQSNLAISGVAVSGPGTPISTIGDGAGLAFSFTVR